MDENALADKVAQKVDERLAENNAATFNAVAGAYQ
jgi:hypothetical protein